MQYMLIDVVKNKSRTSINYYIIRDSNGNTAKLKVSEVKELLSNGNTIKGLRLSHNRLYVDHDNTTVERATRTPKYNPNPKMPAAQDPWSFK